MVKIKQFLVVINTVVKMKQFLLVINTLVKIKQFLVVIDMVVKIKIVLHHKCKTQLMERDTQCPVGFKLVTVMNQSTVVPLSLFLCCRFKCLDTL